MSKKIIYKFDWNEVSALLLADLFLTVLFAFWYVSGCFSRQNTVLINPFMICTLQFLLGFQNIISLFLMAVIINFIIFWVWHRVVKK